MNKIIEDENTADNAVINTAPVAWRWFESKWGEYSYNECGGMDGRINEPLYTHPDPKVAELEGKLRFYEATDGLWEICIEQDAKQLDKQSARIAELEAKLNVARDAIKFAQETITHAEGNREYYRQSAYYLEALEKIGKANE